MPGQGMGTLRFWELLCKKLGGSGGMVPHIFEPFRVSSEAILAHTVLTYMPSVQMCAWCKVNYSTTYLQQTCVQWDQGSAGDFAILRKLGCWISRPSCIFSVRFAIDNMYCKLAPIIWSSTWAQPLFARAGASGVASVPGLPRFHLPFAFTIIHRIRRSAKSIIPLPCIIVNTNRR